mmetsp:Transcript_10423/g.25538  ORF Transcript_10423/g.25538 Transcript_10423/m.25538 type:complete len:225 (-) Transcript_10423:630-1304(-)
MIKSNNKDSDNVNKSQRKLPVEASNGISSTTHLTPLTHQLEHRTSQIYQLNDGVEFNVNSPKQVARILFGEDNTGDTSTNMDVPEAMASDGNEMASCIYKFRKLSREVKREKRRVEQSEKGDRKNDYYGNLAWLDVRKRNGGDAGSVPSVEVSRVAYETAPHLFLGNHCPIMRLSIHQPTSIVHIIPCLLFIAQMPRPLAQSMVFVACFKIYCCLGFSRENDRV